MAPPTESSGTLRYATQRDPRLRIVIPMIVAVAFLMEQLDSTIITTAIPDIGRSLGATPVQMNVAVTAYVLTVAVFIPVSGWFADRFGARRIFVLALGIFTLGSGLCGIAQNFAMLVAMRAVQGLGGAMMTPVGRLILLRSFPRSELVTAMTYMTLPAILGPVIGPLLGGVLTDYASWRWIFYVNLPFGAAGMLAALRFVEDTAREESARFDFPGFLMIGSAVALLQFGMENVSRPVIPPAATVGVIALAVALVLAYARYARRRAAPAVDLTLFGFRTFTVGTLAGGLCRVAINAVPFLLPLMLQVGFGMSPTESGSLTFVGSFGAVAVRAVSKAVLRAFGFSGVLVGSAILATALLAGFALIQADTPRWIIAAYVFVFGLTRSTQFMTSNTLAYADMPSAKLSRATSLGGVLQQLTVSFGVSLAAMLLGLVSASDHVLTPGRFHAVFLMIAILPLISLPGFLRLKPEDGVQVSGYRKA